MLARPFCLVLLAEAAGLDGHVDEGLRWLAEALVAFEASGQGDLLAEAYRLKGELLLHQVIPDAAQAEACFHGPHHCPPPAGQVVGAARSHEPGTALAAAGQASRGPRAPGATYGWFTEGFDTADLLEAKALLEELGA